jgi:hypothetical protein
MDRGQQQQHQAKRGNDGFGFIASECGNRTAKASKLLSPN